VGKLNFFRWAIEKGILDYIKGHQTEIEKEMNAAMREQTKQRSEPSTRDTTASTVTTVSASSGTGTTGSSQTRKRNVKTDTAAIKLLQKHECEIEMRFD
jgi:hypothetical protein